jgi:hypothetical protein
MILNRKVNPRASKIYMDDRTNALTIVATVSKILDSDIDDSLFPA